MNRPPAPAAEFPALEYARLWETPQSVSVTTGAITIYVRWQPEEVAIGVLGESPRVREPPLVVLNDRGELCAVGLEATEAAKMPGCALIHLRSFGDVQRDPAAAANLVDFTAMLVWSEARGSWWQFASAFLPWLRPSLIIHFAGGAERGVSPEAGAPLIGRLLAGGFRRVSLSLGDELGAYALRGAPVRGEWVGGGRRHASHAEYRHDHRNLNAGVLGAIAFTLLQIWSGRVTLFALVPAIACAAWAAVECARRVRLRRRNGVRGPLSLRAMLTRARADLGNNYLILGPVGAVLLTMMGSARAGERGALIGAAGGFVYMVCMALVERYPVELRPPVPNQPRRAN